MSFHDKWSLRKKNQPTLKAGWVKSTGWVERASRSVGSLTATLPQFGFLSNPKHGKYFESPGHRLLCGDPNNDFLRGARTPLSPSSPPRPPLRASLLQVRHALASPGQPLLSPGAHQKCRHPAHLRPTGQESAFQPGIQGAYMHTEV